MTAPIENRLNWKVNTDLRGERSKSAKLKAQDVLEIRRKQPIPTRKRKRIGRVSARAMAARRLAEKYRVSVATIYHIWDRRTWRSLPEEGQT